MLALVPCSPKAILSQVPSWGHRSPRHTETSTQTWHGPAPLGCSGEPWGMSWFLSGFLIHHTGSSSGAAQGQVASLHHCTTEAGCRHLSLCHKHRLLSTSSPLAAKGPYLLFYADSKACQGTFTGTARARCLLSQEDLGHCSDLKPASICPVLCVVHHSSKMGS